MTVETVLDWTLRGLMAALTMWVFLWGKSAKQSEQLLASQFEVRDTKMDEMLRRLDHSGQKASDLADKIMTRINDYGERLAVLETQLRDRRMDGERSRRLGSDDRREHDQ